MSHNFRKTEHPNQIPTGWGVLLYVLNSVLDYLGIYQAVSADDKKQPAFKKSIWFTLSGTEGLPFMAPGPPAGVEGRAVKPNGSPAKR